MNEESGLKPRRADAAEPLDADGGGPFAGLFDAERNERRDRLLAEQGRLLELVARGRTIGSCLIEITAAAGRLLPGARAAILVANADRTSFETAYSSDVPASFGASIEGARIEEFAIGTCGTAVFKGQPVTCTDVESDDRWAPEWRALCKAHGLFACRSEPVMGPEGEAVASLVIFFDQPHCPSDWEIEAAQFCANVAAIAIGHHRSAETLRKSEARLQKELAAARHLQAISTELIQEDDAGDLYRKILDAAIEIMGSQFGSMQLLHPDRRELQLLTFRGFNPESARFWEWVPVNSGSTCGHALATGERSVVSDVETCDFMSGTEDLDSYRKSGIRAVQSTPLVGRGGRIVGMISTHWAEPHEPSEPELRLLDVLARQGADLIDRRSAEVQAKVQQEIFSELINRCPFGIYIVDSEFRIVSMNEGSREGAFANVRPVIGRDLGEAMHILWPEDVAQEVIGRFRATLDSGKPFHSHDFIRKRDDTEQVEGYEWELHRTTLPDGEFGVICYYYDSTELREAQRRLAANEKQQRLLINELNHRVKNSLSIVQALAQQTFDGAGVPREARAAFEGRLEALAQAHNVLTREHWEAAELSDIIDGALEACGVTDRVSANGPPVRLEPRTTVTMTMAIHELCTNAIKYGALSVPGGRVLLDWRIAGERLTIRWEEQGGPPVRTDGRPGFGSRMLQRAAAAELKAVVDLDFRAGGVVCTIDAPLGELVHDAAHADA